MLQPDRAIPVTNRDDEQSALGWNAVQIAASDHVAVALRALRGEAHVLADGRVRRVPLAGDIPMGHKFALCDLPAGTAIRKYGSVIGILSRNVAAGEHLHTHNLVSARSHGRTAPTIDEAG